VFLVFTNKAGGYSIKYPEGWTQSGAAANVTFHDKNNLVHVVIARGRTPTAASVTSELNALKQSDPTLTVGAASAVSIGSGSAIKVVYTTESAPNPVTGKRVKLIVDRYALAHGGRVATVDLGTPEGVDNVDAYRMMIKSFRWQ
jgi:PsbP